MGDNSAARDLLTTLDEALDLLQRHNTASAPNTPTIPLPNLLARCEAQIARTAAATPPLRSLHHFACSGGTLIASCIAAMPNTVLLNEIDPLSKQGVKERAALFSPTDFLVDLLGNPRDAYDQLAVRSFQAGIKTLYGELTRTGQSLVLRDHAHSQFCLRQYEADTRPTLREILTGIAPTRSIVTVRHPRDSYLSLRNNAWIHFDPATLEEYCRRYQLFLDRHDDLPIFRYEDILADPAGAMRQICERLDLGFSPDFDTSRHLFSLSGNSGRAGGPIVPRPPREMPADLAEESRHSASYAALCARLGYTV